MLNAAIHMITEEHLNGLIQDAVSENDTLEYKEQLNLGTIEAKLEFLKDISSFANAKGADFILGVKEDENHKPVEAVALKEFNFDELQRQITDICLSHLEPRLLGLQFREVPLTKGGSAMVIRIPKPWAGPHMVKLKDDNRFYVRVGNQKKVMSVPELRSAFLLPESIAQKMRSFRTERLAKISIHETPVPMLQTAYVVIHILPLASFSQAVEVDLQMPGKLHGQAAPISHLDGWSPGFNFDGFICQSNDRDRKCYSYLQVFRNGCIEAVDNHLLYPVTDRKQFVQADETRIVEALERFLKLLCELSIDPPYFVMLSYLNVKGYFMYRDPRFRGGELVNRDHLVFPEEMVNSSTVDCFKLLKRSFDMLWQACGHDGSPNYDAAGNRKLRPNG